MDSAQSIRVGLARKGLKNKWLADKMSVRPQYITNLCRGDATLGINGIIQVADIFGVKVSEFIAWGENS